MKTTYPFFFLLFFLSCQLLTAQITFTSADLPQIGDRLLFVSDTTTTTINIGTAGANQTWDFSQLTPADTFAVNLVEVAGTPDEDAFPDANIAAETEGIYIYMQQTEDGVWNLGTSADTVVFGITALIRADPPEKIFHTPTSFGTSYSYTSGVNLKIGGEVLGEEVDSLWFKQTSINMVEADAYGAITTPNGTFESLRLHTTTQDFDSVYTKLLGSWILISASESNSEQYHWLAKEAKGAVMTVGYDEEGNVDDIEWHLPGNAPLPPTPAFSFEKQGEFDVNFSDQSTNSPTSWNWDFGDGNTSTEQNPTHTFSSTGEYNVCLTVTNSAGSNTDCQLVNIVSSTAALERDYGFKLFPNPAREDFQIRFKASQNKPARISFFNAMGQNVQSSILREDMTVNTQQWPAGIYSFLVQSEFGEKLGSGKVQIVK